MINNKSGFLASCLNDIKYSQNGSTPLITASFEGHVEIVRILIEAKAQLNTQATEVPLQIM